MRFLSIFVLMFACCTSFAEGLARKLAESAAKRENIAIVFEQEKTMSFFDATLKSKIIFASDSKGRMRWQILEPYESVMIYDGKEVSQFERTADSWRKLNFSSAEKFKKMFMEIRNIVTGKYDAAAYDISERDGRLVITPKNSDVRKVVAEIIITPLSDFSRPDLIEIISGDGDKTLLRIVAAVENPENLDDAFDSDDILKFKLQ